MCSALTVSSPLRRAPHEPLDPDQIADIEQLQQRQVVGAQIVLVRENLDFSRGVVQVDEHAAVAHRADAARDADAVAGFGPGRDIGVAPVEFGGLVLAREADRIRVDAHPAQGFELVEPHPAERVVAVAVRAAEAVELSSAVMRLELTGRPALVNPRRRR